jgi:hypothetical protein
VLPEDEIATMFTLTPVRNPRERGPDCWHRRRGQRLAHPAVRLARAVLFTGFLEHRQTRATLAAWPAAAHMRAASGAERVTLDARREYLEADRALFGDHLGFPPAVPRAHASDRPADRRAARDTAARALVGKPCGEDSDRFADRFGAA